MTLTEGENLLTVHSTDQAGNSASITRTVIYKILDERKIELVSGQDQSGIIGDKLAQPIAIKVLDNQGQPVADEGVVFRVVQGAGIVGADSANFGRAIVTNTDAQGIAQTTFQLGYRTGVANHKIRAKAVGYENDVVFYASANAVIGDKISVNSGNNQRGIVGQSLPAPFIIAVTDNGANTVKGSRVKFTVIKGDGVLQNGQSSFETVTDSDGRASAQLTLGTLAGIDAQRVQATLIDAPAGQTLTAGFMATGFSAAEPGQTSISGIVLDNQDSPLPGVTIRIDGTDRTTTTDDQGQFSLTETPIGPVHIIVDGSTTTVDGEFPALSYHLVTVAGVENPMASPVYMVKLDTENAVNAGAQDVVLTLPDFPGFKLEIGKDSITFPDGSREGLVSVTAVNSSKVPMAPPNGMQPQFIVTIQPVGAVFSPPAKLTLPNVDGHAPGAQVEMYSFDHDLEEFVSIGLGSVSEDGALVTSNPGVGVVKAGWHCGSQPGGAGCAYNCPTCETCENCACVPDPSQKDSPIEQQTDGDCKTATCGGFLANAGDAPSEDTQSDCKKPGCNGSTPVFDLPDDNDLSENDAKCSTCENGEKIVDEDKEAKSCGVPGTTTACYTCKKGSCGNHCNASGDKEVFKIGIPKPVGDLVKLFTKGIGKVQAYAPLKVALDVAGSGLMEKGESCCKNCTVAGPVAENKFEAALEVKASATGFAGIKLPSYTKYLAKDERFTVGAQVGLTGTIAASAAPKFSYTEKLGCPDDGSCADLALQVGLNGKLSVGGSAVAGFQTWKFDRNGCGFYSRERRKKPEYALCWENEDGASGELTGSASAGAEAAANYDTCKGPQICQWKVKSVTLEFGGKLKFAFVFFEFEYEWKPEPVKLSEESSGSCF